MELCRGVLIQEFDHTLTYIASVCVAELSLVVQVQINGIFFKALAYIASVTFSRPPYLLLATCIYIHVRTVNITLEYV